MSTNDEEISIEGFGTASTDRKFDGQRLQKLKTPDPKKGEEMTEFVCRLLPPIKSLKDDEYGWRKYYGRHYGHPGNNPRNPDKPIPRLFGCIKEVNLRTKEVRVPCPKCTQIDKQKSLLDARAAQLKAENPNADDKELKTICREDAKYKAISEWLFKHSCDRAWWMNVMTPKGDFVCFGISHSVMKEKLEPKLKEWREKDKLDVFHPLKGVWIRFTRTGTRPRVTDSVELVFEDVVVNGRTLKDVKEAPMTKEQITRALKDMDDGGAFDLTKDVVPFLSSEKIEALIASNGDQDKVDEIWGINKQTSKVSAGTSTSLEDLLEGEAQQTKATETKAEQKAALDDEEAQLEAQMKALRERKAKERAAADKAVTDLVQQKSSQESAEDFLSNFDE